jgi:hypothetical protein
MGQLGIPANKDDTIDDEDYFIMLCSEEQRGAYRLPEQ